MNGCASIREAPPPVLVDAEPDLVSSETAVVPPIRSRSVGPEAPLPPLPLRVKISPERPSQAAVVSVRIDEPPGPPLEHAIGTVAGRSMGLVRDEGGWIGVAGLPVDSAGVIALEVTGIRNGAPLTIRRAIRVRSREYPSSRIRISAGGGAADPELDARIERERTLIQSRLASSVSEWLPQTSFDWPRPPVRTSPFGERRVFNGQVRSRHMGLDLRGRRGQPVYAAADGRVALAGNFVYQGNAVYLDHGLGVMTAYFHFSSIQVEEGAVVKQGELLGRVGSTGRSTAPHLHWSAYVGGASVDPESLIGFLLASDGTAAADVERRTRNN